MCGGSVFHACLLSCFSSMSRPTVCLVQGVKKHQKISSLFIIKTASFTSFFVPSYLRKTFLLVRLVLRLVPDFILAQCLLVDGSFL